MKATQLDNKSYVPDFLSSFCRSLQRHLTKTGSAIGRSENKTMTTSSSYENEVRPGLMMTNDVLFYRVSQIKVYTFNEP